MAEYLCLHIGGVEAKANLKEESVHCHLGVASVEMQDQSHHGGWL